MSFRLSFLFVMFLASVMPSQAQFRLYEKGHDSYTAGKYPEAINLFNEYLTKRTRDKSIDGDVFYLRALSYYKTNNYQKAIDDFEEAILVDHPNSGNIYWFKAKCNINIGNTEAALSDYNKALSLLTADKQAKAKLLYERSQIYIKNGDLSAAYTDLQNAKAANPSNADVSKELEKLEKQNVASRGTLKETPQTNASVKNDDKKDKPVNDNATVAKTETENKTVTEPINVPSQQSVTTAANPSLADLYKDERRFALVIGNSNYPKNIGVLKNPVNDATDMARELERSNFKVQLLTDATYGQMRAALLKFKEQVDAGDRDKTVSLFYYAGHGLQQDQENFLVPIDAAIEYEDDIARYCFPVQRMVLANMERSNSRINIVILDACRNNPFPSLNRSLGDQGLGEMRRARGSFIAYATAPGSVASDGSGKNGLYTQELIKAMQKPGLTIEQVFKEVRQNVLRFSGDKQNTWDSSNIVGDFYFKF
ncbi:MAG TPA: caspase family protein [Cyclobacteriaceae bacterium]